MNSKKDPRLNGYLVYHDPMDDVPLDLPPEERRAKLYAIFREEMEEVRDYADRRVREMMDAVRVTDDE
jgi:hypothetical protein